MSDRAAVPCAGCTACCRMPWCEIPLQPDKGDEISAYQAVRKEDGSYVIARRPDGACVYLGESGCTIFGADPGQPAVCRRFDCRDLYSHTHAQGRAQLVSDGHVPQEIFDAAEQRLGK